MTTTNLELAEQTAVNASKAVVMVFDFAVSVIEDISTHIGTTLDYHTSGRVNFASSEASLISKFSKTGNQLPRFVYSIFVIDKSQGGAGKAKSEQIPFAMASIINLEYRPPKLIYGIITRTKAYLKEADRPFAQPFLFWLNEDLNKICPPPSNQRVYGDSQSKQFAPHGYWSKYSAEIKFQVEPLLDITKDSIVKYADDVANWFTSNVK